MPQMQPRPSRVLVSCPLFRVLAAVLLWAGSTVFGADTPPRYEPEVGKTFAYDVTIVVDVPTSTTTYQGTIRYEVLDSGNGQMKLRYRGGLGESIKDKVAEGDAFDPFGPLRRRRFPSFPDPFSRPRFAGKVQTTNTITFSERGEVLSMEGDSQLPYLLGNVSLLPFEALPEENGQHEWIVDSGISITKGSESRRRLPPFVRSEPKSVQAGREVSRYSVEKDSDVTLAVRKSYELSTPETEGQTGFEGNGSGTWIFHRQLNMPESLDFEQKLVTKENNTTTTIPITIRYQRVLEEELARRDAETARIAKEREEAAAEAKRLAEMPLTDEETTAALEDLASGEVARLQTRLKMLQAKSVPDPDPAIASAIEPLLDHSNLLVQSEAKKALAKWSPSFKRKVDADKAYRGPSPVKSTERFVGESTRLYRGLLVQVQLNGSFWYPAEVLEVLEDNRVLLQTRGAGNRQVTVTRRQIQLGPEELTQVPDPNDARPEPTRRWWTDASGRFRIQATFSKLDGDDVKLLRDDGKTVTIARDKLSDEDRQYLEKVTQPQPENPFQVEDN